MGVTAKQRFAAAVTGLTCAAALVFAPGADAATEFGDSCTANDTVEAPITFVELSAPGNPLPTAAPVSGVLTHWRLNLIPVPLAIPTTMKVLRLNGAAKSATVVGEATAGALSGSNTFPVRLPIQAGDYLGVSGNSQIGTLICETAVDSSLGTMLNAGPGNSVPYEVVSGELRVPLVGVIEADGDGDGYGDESQDGCPQSALYHSACPVITVSTINVAGKNAVKVLVATSSSAPVKVSGTVKLGKGSKAQLSAKRKTVAAGKLVGFKLEFPGKLKERLKELKPNEKLTLDVTAKATNVAGQVSTGKSKVKLKGQG